MDTQGAFGSTMTVKDCSSIFALSNLISSVQVSIASNNHFEKNNLSSLKKFVIKDTLYRYVIVRVDRSP